MKTKSICILGLGYIGLPTAALFAAKGMPIHGVDVNEEVCKSINAGRVHIEEPGLEKLVRDAVENGLLKADTKPVTSDVYIISVPTPITDGKKADLGYVISAAQMVSKVLKKGDLVILESTVPPHCTDQIVVDELQKSGLDAAADFFLAHCPERVLPGQIIHELIHNNRIIGGFTAEAAKKAAELYALFVEGQIKTTDSTTAEMCKLMENTFRDVNIALANEFAMTCEHLKINVWEAIQLANLHPRVNILSPGPGVGGHCIAVDPWFIVEADPKARLIEMSRKLNDSMPLHVFKRIKQVLPSGKIVILGCTYKPDVDDTRESPIIELYHLLSDDYYQVEIYDPHVTHYAGSLMEKAADADLLVLAVNHTEFKELPLVELGKTMKQKIIFDTRNFLNGARVEEAGFKYLLLGKAYIPIPEMIAKR